MDAHLTKTKQFVERRGPIQIGFLSENSPSLLLATGNFFVVSRKHAMVL